MPAFLKDSFCKIFGNEKNIELFCDLIGTGRMSHAYLLVGPDGSGKKTLAFAVAHALARATSAAGSDALCAKIADRCSADVFLIGIPEDKKTIGVDLVRSIIPSSVLSPNELEFKMYIFDNAEKMTASAQNAMLKIIEEPPANVYIFLLCSDAASILPTVRSRVQTVKMDLLDSDQIDKYLHSAGVSSDQKKMVFASKICGGSIGKATELLNDEKEFELYNAARTIVDKQLEKARGGTYYGFLNYVVAAASTRDRYERLLDYLALAYRDLTVKKVYENADMRFFDADDAENAAVRLPGESIALCNDAVIRMKNDCYFNVNINCAAFELAQTLWHAV